MISVCFQGKPFNITVIKAYSPTSTLKKLQLNGNGTPLQYSCTNYVRIHHSGSTKIYISGFCTEEQLKHIREVEKK